MFRVFSRFVWRKLDCSSDKSLYYCFEELTKTIIPFPILLPFSSPEAEISFLLHIALSSWNQGLSEEINHRRQFSRRKKFFFGFCWAKSSTCLFFVSIQGKYRSLSLSLSSSMHEITCSSFVGLGFLEPKEWKMWKSDPLSRIFQFDLIYS